MVGKKDPEEIVVTRSGFSEFVAGRLRHYVYRLIDPRNGTTFYVGRGQGNRVFSHAAGQEPPTDVEDRETLKFSRIWSIRILASKSSTLSIDTGWTRAPQEKWRPP